MGDNSALILHNMGHNPDLIWQNMGDSSALIWHNMGDNSELIWHNMGDNPDLIWHNMEDNYVYIYEVNIMNCSANVQKVFYSFFWNLFSKTFICIPIMYCILEFFI